MTLSLVTDRSGLRPHWFTSKIQKGGKVMGIIEALVGSATNIVETVVDAVLPSSSSDDNSSNSDKK